MIIDGQRGVVRRMLKWRKDYFVGDGIRECRAGERARIDAGTGDLRGLPGDVVRESGQPSGHCAGVYAGSEELLCQMPGDHWHGQREKTRLWIWL